MHSPHTRRAFLLILLALLALLAPSSSASWALPAEVEHAPSAPDVVITVTTTTDELNIDGDCSLREAIQAANTGSAVDACPAGNGSDTIVLPAGTFVLALAGANEDGNASGDLDVAAGAGVVALSGAGAALTIVDGNYADRVIDVRSGTVMIRGLTIRNGQAGEGGGIRNASDLLVDRSVVTASRAQGTSGADGSSITGGGWPGLGGGIYNGGTLTIVDSTVSLNEAAGGSGGNSVPAGWAGGGGGGAGLGGGIFNADSASLDVTSSTFSANAAMGGHGGLGSCSGGGGGGLGGAIFNGNATLSIQNSTFSGNVARGGNSPDGTGGGGAGTGGGGAFGQGGQGSHIGGAGGWGGGGGGGGGMGGSGAAGGFGAGGGGTPMGSDGGAGSGYAGAVFNLGQEPAAQIGLDHSTITGNQAVRGTPGPWGPNGASYGGGLYDLYGIVRLKGTIVAENIVTDNHMDISGAIVSLGYNLIGISSGGSGFDPTDLLDVNPLLDVLADNGGHTDTHALLPGSPAIDGGTCTDLSGFPVVADQRGVRRPLGVTCDIGAYEAATCLATPDDGLSVFGTVQEAIDASLPGGVVKIAGTCIDLFSRDGHVQVAYVDKDLTLRGGYVPGDWIISDPVAHPTTLDAGNSGRVVYVAAGVDATLENLSLTGGSAPGAQGGGVYHAGASLVLNNNIISGNSADSGAGLMVAGGLATLNTGQISNNTATVWGGGGVWVDTGTSFVMNGGEISDNTNMGVYVAHGQMTLTGGQISRNTGMGVFVHNGDAFFTQTGGSISANTNSAGAGLYVKYGSATLTGGEIVDNVATGTAAEDGGGGLYVYNGQAMLGGVQILRNMSTRDGGGVYVRMGSVPLSAGRIGDNVAGGLGGGLYVAPGASAQGSGVQIVGNWAAAGGALYQATTGAIDLSASCIVDNSDTGVVRGGGSTVAATGNWWGAADGPSGAGPGSGDSVSAGVDYGGFLVAPPPGCPLATPPDLFVAKMAEPVTAMPGDTVTYTLNWANAGAGTARNVTIVDSVPISLTAVTWSAAGVPVTAMPGITLAWTAGDVPAEAGGIIRITGVVSPQLAGLPAWLDNQASIATTSLDANPADNASSAAIALNDVPVAGLAVTSDSPTTVGQPTAFTATLSAGTNVGYAWSFGDGAYGSGANASHLYAAAGSYTAVVTATNGAGSLSAATPVSVTNLPPMAYEPLYPLFATVGQAVMLDGSWSVDPDGHYPLTYGWAQVGGPGVTLSDPHAAQATFTAPDTPAFLSFLLVVTDAYGLADPTPGQWGVMVEDMPMSGLTVENDSPTTLGQPTLFTATVSAGTNVVYDWSFGDGQYGSGANAGHVYAAAGAYTAVVTATNGASSATASTPVLVTNLTPVADAGPDQAAYAGYLVALDGSASADPDGHLPLAFGWTQTAGPPAVLTDPHAMQPAFTAPPVPAVLAFTLAVTDAFGLPDPTPDSVVVTVGDEPIAGLSLTSSSPTPFGQPTWFTATVTAGTNVELTFDWGDGESGLEAWKDGRVEGWKNGRMEGWKEATFQSANLPTFQQSIILSHTYSLAGNYTAVVTATNAAGQQSTASLVSVTAPPACTAPLTNVAIHGLPDAFLDLTWFFSATVEPAAATPPITFTWSPAPAAGQGTALAAYTWSQTGTVILTLTAENCGGMASASFAVDVQSGVAVTVEPGITTTLIYTDPQGVTSTVTIPPDAVPEEITLLLTPKPTSTHPISPSLAFGGLAFRLDAWLGQQFLPGYIFDRPVPVTIGYGDQAVANLQEDQLKLYRWSGTAWRDGAEPCSPPAGYVRDLANNRFTTAICQLSEWNIQGPQSIRIYYAYLPVVVPARLHAPDLVVERLTASSDNVQVVIRNQGTAAVRRPFWVDVYVDPSPPPTHVNQIWEQLGDQGLAWAVASDALPLLPGQSLVLTVGDPYYWTRYSYVEWPLPAGTPLYAQVDSANAGVDYGAVREVDELRGDPYNNILGPVSVVPGALDPPPVGPPGPPPVGLGLPARR